MNRRYPSALAVALVLVFGCAAVAPARAECTWSLFPTVNPEPSGNQLAGVSGTGPHDVWEVGAVFHKVRSAGYALHWNGTAWATFPEADPERRGGQLSGVAALANDDVWTVGQRNVASGVRAVVEHWDGGGFSVAPVPSPPKANTFFYSVFGLAPNDVWSAGGSQTGTGLQRAYVVHWDGNAWTQSTAADVPGAATNLDALAGSGPNDVWVVGGSRTTAGGPFRTLAEHWNGGRWSIVPTPNANLNSNVFNAAVALGPNDVWAVGDYYNGKAFTALAEHWDGRSWSIVTTPNSGTRTAFVLGAAAAAPDEVWAVGEIAREHGRVVSYILRWNGRQWHEVPSPNVPGRLVTLLNGAAKIPGGSIWAVGGDANTKIVVHTVTEVRACAKETSATRR